MNISYSFRPLAPNSSLSPTSTTSISSSISIFKSTEELSGILPCHVAPFFDLSTLALDTQSRHLLISNL